MTALPLVVHAMLAAATSDPARWSYEVSVPPDARVLSIIGTFPEGSSEELSVESGTEEFVRELTVMRSGQHQPVSPRGTSWFVSQCIKGCRVEYKFALGEAAASLANSDLAAKYGDVYESPPGAWLLRPLRARSGTRLLLRVDAASGQFATGLAPIANAVNTFEASADELPRAPYSAFGPMKIESFKLRDAQLQIAFAPMSGRLELAEIVRWIRSSAGMVDQYFGRFPISHALVLVLPGRQDRINGRTLGGGGATILLWLGPEVSARKLGEDWVLVHELVHLGFPTVMRRHHWAEEGLATYVEPLARSRAGALSIAEVWSGLLRGLPKGLPQEGDRGLDRTPTWGRTYWGGALFWFLADIRIRQRTSNQKSLDDALRAIVAQGGNIGTVWDFDHILAVGDRATGEGVLKELYAQMSLSPTSVDLDSLFDRLGVKARGGALWFDEEAPLAKIRRSMTAASVSSP